MASARHTVVAAFVFLGTTSIAATAQEPVRLPGIVVKAPVNKPGAKRLVGVVRDTFQFAIDSAEVTIPVLQRRLMSDSGGKFTFADVKPGKYIVRARKIGYAPSAAYVDVDSSGGVGTIDMMPLQRALPPMIIAVARGGISGVVGDTAYHAIRGAEVRLLGHGTSVESDSLGGFYFDVRPGKYMLGIRRQGYTDRVVSVTVPPDSGRRVDVFLGPRTKPVPVREVHNIEDFGSRMAWRKPTTSTVYSHDDLEAMHIQWINEAVEAGYHRAGGQGPIGNGCAAVLNGGPDIVMTDALTVDDVETVEIYPPGSFPLPSSNTRPASSGPVGPKRIAHYTIPMHMSNTEIAAWRNFKRTDCTLVYIWTR